MNQTVAPLAKVMALNALNIYLSVVGVQQAAALRGVLQTLVHVGPATAGPLRHGIVCVGRGLCNAIFFHSVKQATIAWHLHSKLA